MTTRAHSRSVTFRKYLYIILPTFIASIIAYLDRVNIAYAALTMNADLGFSAQVFGMGAGIFSATCCSRFPALSSPSGGAPEYGLPAS